MAKKTLRQTPAPSAPDQVDNVDNTVNSDNLAKVDDSPVLIIGGGPAGLTAAYELMKAGRRAIVLEKDAVVGGLSRTVSHQGYRFDIGGHRFFTKVKPVDDMWREVLSEADFLHRRRLSRIYFDKKFFHYPLRPGNALWKSGVWNSFLILASYLKAQLRPQKSEATFEQWVKNRFGERLYRTFFKTYTEKVWGMPCHEISAEWAAQRIRGLSLLAAVKNSLSPTGSDDKSRVLRTLVDAFDYPRLGPGMMWQTVAERVQQAGHTVRLSSAVTELHLSRLPLRGARHVLDVEIESAGRRERIAGSHVVSSMPLRELCECMTPAIPEAVLQAARGLRYRDFLTVALIVNRAQVFPDHWIYIHDPGVKLGRIQNFKNWSPDMVPDAEKTCLGLEYFCFEGDGLWSLPDEELIALGTRELAQLGLCRQAEIEGGAVTRMPKAYPVYDSMYQARLEIVREFLSTIDNLQVVGRNGMHRYNNQDHSMWTAMLAVQNILGAEPRHDLWAVNAEPEYHEELGKGAAAQLAATQPRVPTPAASH
jgi:protoporphyrinogen oxidase